MPASRARRDLVRVLEQPGELGGREVGVEGKAARRLHLLLAIGEPIEHLLRALVLPDDDRAQRLARFRVPGEHRLALVVEPGGDHLAGGVGPAPRRSPRRRRPRTSSPSCSTHPGCGWRLTLSRRASATGRSSSSNSAALTPVVPSSRPSSRRPLTTPLPRGGGRYAATTARRVGSPWMRGARQRPLGREATPSSADQPDDVLGDPQRRGQARWSGSAATLIRPAKRAGRADRVVHAPPGRPQAGVASRSARRPRAAGTCARGLRQHLAGRVGAHRPVLLVLLVVGRRAGDHLAVDGREHEHSLRSLGGNRQQDALERRRRVEDEELALARIDLEGVVARQPRDLVGVEPRAVHRDLRGHGLAARLGQADRPAGPLERRDPKARYGPRRRSACGRRGEREGERDRVGHRLTRAPRGRRPAPGCTSTPFASAWSRMAATVARSSSSVGDDHGAAAQHRDAELVQDRVAQRGRSQDEPGLELAGVASRTPCGGSPSSCRSRPAQARPRASSSTDRHAAAPERERDRRADDAAADHRDLEVGADRCGS